ncbi:MAG TPA: hypothetical protein VGG20_10290 [Thermoanaerobaculia bacterium]|jgi:hypothetical protein
MFVGHYGPSVAIKATRLSRKIPWAANALALLLAFGTGGTFLTTSVWMGDGSAKSVQVYAGDAPIQVWSAQQLFLALRAEIAWQREYERPQCQMHEGL